MIKIGSTVALDKAESLLREGQPEKAIKIAEYLIQHEDELEPAKLAQALLIFVESHLLCGRYPPALNDALGTADALAIRAGDTHLEGRTALRQGQFLMISPQPGRRVNQAVRLFKKSARLFNEADSPDGTLLAMINLGDALVEIGDHAGAQNVYQLAQTSLQGGSGLTESHLRLSIAVAEQMLQQQNSTGCITELRKAMLLADAEEHTLYSMIIRAKLAVALGLVVARERGEALSAAVGPDGRLAEASTLAIEAVRLREVFRSSLMSLHSQITVLAAYDWIDRVAWDLAVSCQNGWGGIEVMELDRARVCRAALARDENLVSNDDPISSSNQQIVRLELELISLLRIHEKGLSVNRPSSIARAEIRLRDARELSPSQDEAQPFPQDWRPDLSFLRLRLCADTHVLVIDWWETPSSIRSSNTQLEPAVGLAWLGPEANEPELFSVPLSDSMRKLISTVTSPHAERSSLMDISKVRHLLAQAVIPPPLRNILVKSESDQPIKLLIVPSGSAWGLPFAAMDIASDGGFLINHAELTLIPSLSLLGRDDEEPTSDAHGVILVAAPHVLGADLEEKTLSILYGTKDLKVCDQLTGRVSLLNQMSSTRFALGVFSSHGNDSVGLSHGVCLPNGEWFTASDLLGVTAPRVLILGACYSGRLRFDRAQEPIGLPTVALIQGSDAVIVGMWALPSMATGRILSRVYETLHIGTHTQKALRLAQLDAIRQGCVPSEWAGLSVISRFVRRRDSTGDATFTPAKKVPPN